MEGVAWGDIMGSLKSGGVEFNRRKNVPVAMQNRLTTWPLLSLRTGKPKVFGPRGEPSAIDKQALSEPVFLGYAGFSSDQQGDPRHHGGPEKAVHHYAAEHYALWAFELSDSPGVQNLVIGGFGENISTYGLTEESVSAGDIFRLGHALIQVSQPRQPCWKLNVRFNVSQMALRVQTSGRTGWYYRVLEPGWVAPDSCLDRVERPYPAWTLSRVQNVLYRDRLNTDELRGLAAVSTLTEKMHQLVQKRLDVRQVEAWESRLDGVRSSSAR